MPWTFNIGYGNLNRQVLPATFYVKNTTGKMMAQAVISVAPQMHRLFEEA